MPKTDNIHSNRRILVTGGAGFVGSAVVRELLSSTDAEIHVVDNLVNGRREFLPSADRLELHKVDLCELGDMLEVFAAVRPDTVIHLAAIHFIPYCNQHPLEAIDINIRGTESLLQACRVDPPGSVIAASSAAVYPIHDGLCHEDNPTPEPTDIYGITKLTNEMQLQLFASQSVTKCAAVRLSNVYGPRETNPHVLPEIIEQMLAGNTTLKLGNVKPQRDYVFVDDVAKAIVALGKMNLQPFQAYNVSTGHEYSVEELVERLADISGMGLTIETDPDRTRKSDRPHLVLDNSRLRSVAGWQPDYDIDRGLRMLWAWSCEHLAKESRVS